MQAEGKNRILFSLAAAGVFSGILAYTLDPMVFEGKIPADRDTLCFFYPFLTVFQWGGVPLWNPYELSGSSLVANPQAALFYPPNAILFLLSPRAGYAVTTFGHYLGGGMGVFLLLRRFRACTLGSLFGGCVFILGGYMQARLMHRPLLLSAAWMPWVLLLFHVGIRGDNRMSPCLVTGSRPGGSWLLFPLLASLALACSLLPGMYHNGVFAAMAVGLLALAETRSRRSLIPALGLSLVTIGAGFAGAGVSLLPAMDLLSHTVRTEFDYAAASTSSLEWRDLGWVFLGIRPDRAVADWTLLETSASLGIAGVFFAGAGLVLPWVKRGKSDPCRRIILYLAVLFCFGLLFALGKNTPVHRVFFSLPGGRFFNNPSRALSLCALAGSVLAGLGVSLSLDRLGRLFGRGGRALVILAALAGTILLLRQHNPLHVGFTEPSFEPEPAPIAFLKERTRENPGRIMTYDPLHTIGADLHWTRFRTMLMPKIAMIDRLEDISGYDPLHLRTYAEYVRDQAGQAPGEDPWRVVMPERISPELLNRMSVRYVLGEVQDRSAWQGELALSRNLVRPVPIRWSHGPARSMRVRTLLDRSLGLAQGTMAATLIVDGTGETGERKVFELPLRAGIETADRFADSIAGCRHEAPDPYRRYAQSTPGGVLAAQDYEARVPFPEIITPDALRLEVRIPGVFVLLNVVMEKAGEEGPFIRVFEEGPYRIYENTAALPRIRREPEGEASLVRMGNHTILAKTQGEQPGMAVFSEVHYPGWQATVDGEEVPIERVDGVFRGVRVPAGEHTIRMQYWPPSLTGGMILSGSVLLITIVVALRRSRSA